MPPSQAPASAIEYDVIVHRNVPVPMRDGVCLAADLYLPARDGQPAEDPFPAVMERTPYDKANKYGEGRYFARRGYVAVMQDVRGRFASEGTWYPFAFDVNPNTGGLLGRERRFVLAENAVYHDPQHPSHVVLPIIARP
jgi:predicted acyl esterase